MRGGASVEYGYDRGDGQAPPKSYRAVPGAIFHHFRDKEALFLPSPRRMPTEWPTAAERVWSR